MKVAIVDDDKTGAETTAELVTGAGHEPVIFSKLLKTPSAAARKIMAKCDAIVSDHRLQHHKLASYFGSQLVAACFKNRLPGLLLTQFFSQDNDVSIRLCRRDLPVVLARDDVDATRIAEGLDTCRAELQGKIPADRKAIRQLLRVESVTKEDGFPVADVIIPGWRENQAVRLPIELFPLRLRKRVRPDSRFFAYVNTGAHRAEDLFFDRFEVADDPDDNDGLQ